MMMMMIYNLDQINHQNGSTVNNFDTCSKTLLSLVLCYYAVFKPKNFTFLYPDKTEVHLHKIKKK